MTPKAAKGDIQRKTFSVVLDPALAKEVKMLAVKKETTISDIVEQAIKAFLKKK
jgi:predicted transcriptional regulator